MSDLVNFDNDLIVYQGDSGNTYTLSGEFQLVAGRGNNADSGVFSNETFSSFIPYVTWSSDNTPSRFTGALPYFGDCYYYTSGAGSATVNLRYNIPDKPYLKLGVDDSGSFYVNEGAKIEMRPELSSHPETVSIRLEARFGFQTDPIKAGDDDLEKEYEVLRGGSAIYQGEVISGTETVGGYRMGTVYYNINTGFSTTITEYTATLTSIELGNWPSVTGSTINNMSFMYDKEYPGRIIKHYYLMLGDHVYKNNGTEIKKYWYSSVPNYYNIGNFYNYTLYASLGYDSVKSANIEMSAKTWTATITEGRLPDPEFIAY